MWYCMLWLAWWECCMEWGSGLGTLYGCSVCDGKTPLGTASLQAAPRLVISILYAPRFWQEAASGHHLAGWQLETTLGQLYSWVVYNLLIPGSWASTIFQSEKLPSSLLLNPLEKPALVSMATVPSLTHPAPQFLREKERKKKEKKNEQSSLLKILGPRAIDSCQPALWSTGAVCGDRASELSPGQADCFNQRFKQLPHANTWKKKKRLSSQQTASS